MLVLYKDDTTSFSNLGLGVLKDLRSDALITEELNGSLILEFEYIKKGHLSDSLVEGNLIKCNNQIFRIKNINKSLSDSESIKILAQQYFQFDMSKNFLADVAPTKLNGTNALKWIVDKAETKTNFVIGGDCTNVSSARYVRKNVSDAIYSADNSLLSRFGGELEFNLNNVYLKNKRGSDKGFSIRYRKNLKGLEFNLDFSTVATKICPQGSNELLLDDLYVSSPKINNYYQPFFKKVEFNDIGVDEETTEEQAKTLLKNAALELFDAGIDVPEISIKVDFVELSKCIEYKEYQNLETCSLGDTIKVIIPEFSINTSVRVVKTIYNDNLGRLTYLELGTVAKNIVSSNASSIKDIKNTIENPKSILDSAKKNATELINHPFKGNLYIDDKTGVLYLMDTNDISTAKNVWKWSMGGLGFSSNGINGTFNTAITQDGGIVADFITTGKINTDLIEGYSNLELAVQNSLLSITPQYCIEGTDEWSDTIPTTETWQKILTRNKYVATNGKITYSKVIPYVEGMNNLINSIEGTDVSIYNSNDEEMGLESIVLEGRCTQKTRSGKNLFDKNATGTLIGVNKSVLNTGVRITLTSSSNYRYISINVGGSELLGKTLTFGGIISPSSQNSGSITLYFGSSSNTAISFIANQSSSGSKTITIPNEFPSGANEIHMLLYGKTTGEGNIGDYVDYTNLMLVIGNSLGDYEDYGVMPSPDYPSEVECINGKNLFDLSTATKGFISMTTGIIDNNQQWTQSDYIKVLPNTSYTLSNSIELQGNGYFELTKYTSNKTWISSIQVAKKGDKSYTFTTDSNVYYVRVATYKLGELTNNFQLEKDSIATNYVPYNNLQIRNVGKNLLDISTNVNDYYINVNGVITSGVGHNYSQLISVSNGSYTWSGIQTRTTGNTKRIHAYDEYGNWLKQIDTLISFGGEYSKTFIISDSSIKYIALSYYNDDENVQFEKGSTATSYEPYKSQTLNIDLQGNELCSRDDVKDELIIKNGRAKIIKRIGKREDNIVSNVTNTYTNIKYYQIVKPTDYERYNKYNYADDTLFTHASTKNTTTTWNSEININKMVGGASAKFFWIGFPLETTLEQAQELLSNNCLYYALAEEQEIDLGEVDIINLFTEENNISNSESANMKIGYYTDYTFYKTVIEQYAKIDLNTDNINIELAKKTNSKDIIATINMSTEKDDEGSLIQINSDKLNIKNKAFNLQSDNIQITSPNFSLTTEGKITSKSGEIGGFKLTDTSFSTHVKDVYTYTQTDAARVLEIANGSIATEAEKKKYDVNEDGVIDRLDYTIILRKIYGYEATEGDFFIYSNDPRYMIKTSTNGTKTKPTKIGLTMMSTTEYVGCRANFTNFDDSTSQTIIDGGQINCVALTQTSLEQHKKNIEKFSNALEEIKKTDIYQYNWKLESDDKKKHLGFVIGKNFNYSHLITAENEEGNEIGVDNYSMTSLCLQAIKEQQVIIENLETKINTLMKGIK